MRATLEGSVAIRSATLGYVAPFAVFIGVMALEHSVGMAHWLYPTRLIAVIAVLFWFSRPYLTLRASSPLASTIIGAAVFAIWIAPDNLFGYRHHWLFENSITGAAASSAPAALKHNVFFIIVRVLGCVAVVPVVEELFWRGWLMRWLIHNNFIKVPLGQYAAAAFWIVAVLFASEHGPYWEVGLAAGIIYNWWMIRTKSLADCILAHAVTNGLLSAWVLATGQWQYWL